MAFQLSGGLNNIMLLKFFNAYVNNGLNKKDGYTNSITILKVQSRLN